MSVDKFVSDTLMMNLQKNPGEAKEFVAHLLLAEPAIELMMARKKTREALEGMGCTRKEADEIIEEELNTAVKEFEKWESKGPHGPKMKVFLDGMEITHHDEEEAK